MAIYRSIQSAHDYSALQLDITAISTWIANNLLSLQPSNVLQIVFDQSMYISALNSKARQLIGVLYYKEAQPSTLLKLYLANIRPHLEHYSPVWNPYRYSLKGH